MVFGGPGPHVVGRVLLWTGALMLILILTASGAGSDSWLGGPFDADEPDSGGGDVRACAAGGAAHLLVFFNTYGG